MAKKLNEPHPKSPIRITTSSTDLCKDDVVLVEAGDVVPDDGEVIDGVASVGIRDHGRIGAGDPRIGR